MATDRAASLGRLVRRLRLAAGLSQEELAERSGLSTRGVSDLERGLRASPRPETVRMLADALALAPADRAALIAAARPELAGSIPTAAPAQASPSRAPLEVAPLPAPPTRLVGRETEVTRLCALLRRDEVRLVTLTGPGGVGKTRLAMAVAGELVSDNRFADGVAFVELAPLREPDLVAAAIAAGLGVEETDGRPSAEALRAALRDRRFLLVLDNCEHVLPAAPLVAELLAACPGLMVLATGRERLHLRGEHEVSVAPLALPAPPDPAHPAPLAGLKDVPSIRLFVERAEEATSDFALTDDNAPAVAELCRRLDGLPLAIELAAVRVKLFPPPALLAGLSSRLQLLRAGPEDLPPRHRALRDTVAWSYDLLTPEEQDLFRRLAVFAQGFTLEAAHWVGEGVGAVTHDARPVRSPSAPAAPRMLDLLASLLDKSLLMRGDEAAAAPRFSMLQTIREFALEQLALAGEEEAARTRHAAWCLNLAVGVGSPGGPEQAAWLARLEAQLDELRAALDWTVAHDPQFAVSLVATTWRFWLARGHLAEGSRWLNRALAAARMDYDAARAQALYGASMLEGARGDESRAWALAEELLAAAEGAHDPIGASRALNALGSATLRRGDLAGAATLFDRALDRARAAGDEEFAAAVAESLTWVDRLRAPKRRGSALLVETLNQALTTEQP